jgi:hypothetical protein
MRNLPQWAWLLGEDPEENLVEIALDRSYGSLLFKMIPSLLGSFPFVSVSFLYVSISVFMAQIDLFYMHPSIWNLFMAGTSTARDSRC